MLGVVVSATIVAVMGIQAQAGRFGDESGQDTTLWCVNPPLLGPGPPGAFDEVSVKDPSIVFHGNRWHLFYTARSRAEYSLGYVSAERLEDLGGAERTRLDLEGYAAAPQVFFFTPQETWYLVFQTTAAYYQPVFMTTQSIDNPLSWSPSRPLVEKDDEAKWIDFWVICDEDHAYLFYTRSHQELWAMKTTREAFPEGFAEPVKVFEGLHEAAHIYKVRDDGRFVMLYEQGPGVRHFGLAVASQLPGPWKRVDDRWASAERLDFPEGVPRWTEMVSHGELLRAGYDERLQIPADEVRFLIQGAREAEIDVPYPQIPWRLGLIDAKEPLLP